MAMRVFFVIALLLLAPPPQSPAAQPGTRCVPLRVVVEGGGPPPPSLTFALAGGSTRPTVTVRPSAAGILLPDDERRISLVTSLPSGYTVSAFTYGSTNLLRDPIRASNNDRAELSLTLSAAPGSWTSVSGRVTGVDLSARNYFVALMNSATFEEDRQRVAADGSFTFAAVVRGSHTIELQSPGGIPVSRSVVVAGDRLTGVDLVSPPQREVPGLVIKDGDSVGTFYNFSLLLQDGTRQQMISPAVASNGTFRIALPEGERRVSLSGFPAGAVLSFTYGDTNLLTGPLRVSREDTGAIRITLAAATRPSGVVGGMPYFGPGSCVVQTSQGLPVRR